MKKLFITLISVALLTGSAIAQQGDGGGNGSGPAPGGMGPHLPIDLTTLEDVPGDVQQAFDDAKAGRETLRVEREAAIAALGEDPTDDALRAALEQWRSENEEQIAEIRENAEVVREYFRAQREERQQSGESDGMKQRRMQFREEVQVMREAQEQLRLQLQNGELSEADREALVQAFREENRETMRKLKAIKRQQRLEQGDGGGDRRQGPGA
jgi:hypothetical protein